MPRSRRLLEHSPIPGTTTCRRHGALIRLSSSAATCGLVAVLLVLTAFSVAAAVTNAWVSAEVEERAAVRWSSSTTA